MKAMFRKLIEDASTWHWWREWILIFLGCIMMGTAFVFFINPYKFVPGGVAVPSLPLSSRRAT